MHTIAILGANGQVGSEVCLFLSLMSDIRVVPICRTRLASVFLRRCGLECRHGSLNNSDEARRLLEGADLVADFSLPRGLPSEVNAASQAIIGTAIAQAPP